MEAIDRKYVILANNAVNGKQYTEFNSFLFSAKDKAVPAALRAYIVECDRIGATPEHIHSVRLLLGRVERYQIEFESKVPTTIGDEIPRCLGFDKMFLK